MKKLKRILALAGAVLLLLLYASTLVFAVIGSPVALHMLAASVAATILIPVLLYGYQLTARVLRGRGTDAAPGSSGPEEDSPGE